MKVKRILECIETDHINFEHIDKPDLNSIALVKRGVGGLSVPSSEPIIDVQVKKIKTRQLLDKIGYKEDTAETEVVCLITSNSEEDVNKALNLVQVVTKLKELDAELEVYEAYENRDNNIFCNIINFDGSGIRDNHCERKNMPKDYKGNITDFWA